MITGFKRFYKIAFVKKLMSRRGFGRKKGYIKAKGIKAHEYTMTLSD